MAKKNATTFNQLFAMLEAEIQGTLRNKNGSVANTAVEKGKEHVQTDVYDVYTPVRYQRSGQLKESWEVQDTPEGIMIVNTRSEDGKDIAYIVHEAEGYTQSFPYENTPRPFLTNAVEELNRTGELSDALMADLRKRGFVVQKR